MQKINQKAYNNLDNDEKMALGLQLTMNKSSWEAGEIMDKSHYKYLEIKHRAEKFIRMFSDYYKYYDDPVPDFIDCPKYLRFYLNKCIADRLKTQQSFELTLKEFPNTTKQQLNNRLTEFIIMLTKTEAENVHHKHILNFVKDFDRWNKFRILPKEVQEPSAYKRRLKNTYKKHIKVLNRIPDISLDKICEIYKAKSKNIIYFPFMYKGKPRIEKIHNSKNTIRILSELGIYLFTDKSLATRYIVDTINYLTKKDRDCKDGLEFWPKYREYIKLSTNYSEVQNIAQPRKYLDLALDKLQFL